MIKVSDSFYLNASIEGNDILDVHNFKSLLVIEEVGTDLPQMNINFNTASNEVVQLLSEARPISLSFGDDKTQTFDSKFVFIKPNFRRETKDLWNVNSSALHWAVAGWNKPAVRITDEPIDCFNYIKSRVETYYAKVNMNVKGSNDKQNWIQTGVPLKNHLDDTWLHADVGKDSYPLIAATLNEFRIFSAKECLPKEDPKFIFSPTDKSPNAYAYSNHYAYESRSDMLNSLGARGMVMQVHDLSTGKTSKLESSPILLFSPADSAPLSSAFSKVNCRPQTLSRNHHPNYWESYIHNSTQLLFASSAIVTLAFYNTSIDVHPLDVVLFKDDDILVRNGESNEMSGGLFIVTKVSREIINRQINITVQMCRETFVLNTKGLKNASRSS